MLPPAARGGLPACVRRSQCVLGHAAAVHPIPDEYAAYRAANGVTIAFTGAKEREGD